MSKTFLWKLSEMIFRHIPEISSLQESFFPDIVPVFWITVTFSIMEMEKISGSFPYVNRNPEFRWKPYQ